MSLLHPDPTCTVNTDPTTDGNNVNPLDDAVSIELVDTAGVKQWSITCTSTDDLNTTAAINATIVVNNIAKTATFTAPDVGSAMQFKSVVNNGKDANGADDPSLTTYFGIYVLTTSNYRVAFFDEKLEGSAAFGWITKLNAVVRNNLVTPASAGNGLVFFSGAYNVVPNADASIVVNANDIQLKAAYQTLLNAATATNTASTLVLRATGTNPTGIFNVATGTLSCSGLASLTNVAISGNTTNAGTFACTGAVTCSTTLGVTGNATIGGTLGVTGTFACTGAATFASSVSALSHLFTGAITETRISPQNPAADPANWKSSTAALWSNLSLGTELHIPINPPQGATLNTLVVRFQGATAHAGLPAVMPTIALKYFDVGSGLTLSVTNSGATDLSANTTAYQLVHTITANNAGGGIGHVIDKTTRKYFVVLTAESGANALVGALYYQTSMTWNRAAGSNVGQD